MPARPRKPAKKSIKPEAWIRDRKAEGAVLASAGQKWTLEGILGDLGIEIHTGFGQLLEFLGLVKGKFSALDALVEGILLAESPSKWESTQFLLARTENRPPSLDEIVDEQHLSRVEVAAGMAAACFMTGVDTSRAILGANLGDVIRASVNSATDPDGGMIAHADRKLLMDASGLLAKSPSTIVNVNTQNNLAVGLPQWSEVDKVVSKAYFGKDEQKGLPPAKLENVVDAVLVEEVVLEPVQ